MANLSPTINQGFSYYFDDFAKTVRTLSENLSEQEFWTNPYPYGNSFGHLVLHITGNLSYYIGAQLAETGYTRNRAREFSEKDLPSKEAALQALETAVKLSIETLGKQTDADWARAYSAVGVDDVHDRFAIFLRCSIHFHHHIGQMMYVVDEHTKHKNRSSAT